MTAPARQRLQRRALGGFGRLPEPLRRWLVRRVTPAYTVGALCIVERADGRLLLVRHGYRARWGLPGGFLKRGEVPADGARREVVEEIGLAVELRGEPAVVVDPAFRRVDVVYRATPAVAGHADDVRPVSPEIVEVAWFRPDALPELQPEAVEAMMAVARSARDDLSRQVRPSP